MKLLNLRNLFRPICYSIVLVLGMSVSFDQLSNGDEAGFFMISLLISLILVIEIYTSWSFFQLRRNQINFNLDGKYHYSTHWVHHLILPVLSYFSACLFIYYNQQQSIRWFLYAVTLIMFTALFYNLRSYFEAKHDIEHATHYIYDILKMYMFFMLNNVMINAVDNNWEYLLVPIGSIILVALFTLLSLGRNQLHLHTQHLALAFLTAALIGGVILATMLIINLMPLEAAFVNLFVFYLGNATLHHYLEKTLSFSLVLEYGGVLILAVAILAGN